MRFLGANFGTCSKNTSTEELLFSRRTVSPCLLGAYMLDMEEADVLGDRIGIMHQGSLHCCGNSVFLKNRFGAGYSLNIVGEEKNFHPDDTHKFVSSTSFLPYDVFLLRLLFSRNNCLTLLEFIKSQVLSSSENDTSILLPLDSVDKFPELFVELEQHKQKLRIASFGVSMTTLEDVFITITKADKPRKNR